MMFHVESSPKLKKGMPEECQDFCLLAVSVLLGVCHQIQTRDITMQDLQKINRAKEQMERLCQAASKPGDKTERGELSFESIDAALRLSMEEFQKFEEYQGQLSHLCDQIPHNIKGLFLEYTLI